MKSLSFPPGLKIFFHSVAWSVMFSGMSVAFNRTIRAAANPEYRGLSKSSQFTASHMIPKLLSIALVSSDNLFKDKAVWVASKSVSSI